MKVFDLACEQGHRFEGWFGSEDDYASQRERGLLSCPMCPSVKVERLPSAPRLNLHHPSTVSSAHSDAGDAKPSASSGGGQPPVPPEQLPALMQAAYLHAVKQVVQNTEDVGARFAEEARRIHYGEAPSRGIRGQSSGEDIQSLRDEGIEILSLPIPPGLDKASH